ncbi:MAG TPA: ABC transporter C-terminal domain-containing protein, partial [Pseudosphingobacterium sp.]|nr:ABC transporter C-terminal domain-containing protein [Pseudosphingobacterium sp.]
IKEEKPKAKISFKEQKEFGELEQEIVDLENLIKTKTLALNKTEDHSELITIADEIKELTNMLAIKSERWLELGELI